MTSTVTSVARSSARLVLGLGLLSTLACAATRESDPQAQPDQSEPEPDAGRISEEMPPDDGEYDGIGGEPDAGPMVMPHAPTERDASVVDLDAGALDAAVVIEDSGAAESDAPPLALAPCPEEDANVCPETDPLCYWESGPGGAGGGGPDGFYSFLTGWSVCTRFCETDADCPSALGTASCVEAGTDHICLFDCSFGRSCPGDLACSYGDRCANHFCECTGVGCDQPLCQPTDG
jgi:hypothetical protein